MTASSHRRTIVRALVAAVAVLFAIGGTAVAADAHTKITTPFVITSITPGPNSTDGISGGGTYIYVTFNQPIGNVGRVELTDDTNQWDASGGPSYGGNSMMIFVTDCAPTAGFCAAGLLPSTTYSVTLGGEGKRAITDSTGTPLTGSDVAGVTFKSGAARFTFTTAP
jgi:hypothetical protein